MKKKSIGLLALASITFAAIFIGCEEEEHHYCTCEESIYTPQGNSVGLTKEIEYDGDCSDITIDDLPWQGLPGDSVVYNCHEYRH